MVHGKSKGNDGYVVKPIMIPRQVASDFNSALHGVEKLFISSTELDLLE
jgi:hypothetical protein